MPDDAMKHLIELPSPHDYHWRGISLWLNPDRIVSVRSEGGETVVKYSEQLNGGTCRTVTTLSPEEVNKLISDATTNGT